VPENPKITVYVVDDDDSVRDAINMLLQSARMNVHTFKTGDILLNSKLQEKECCLISDVKMKGIDGFSLYKKLHAIGVDIPVIFLTAFDSQDYRQHAREIGAAGYLTKPVDDQALIDAIHWAVTNRKISIST